MTTESARIYIIDDDAEMRGSLDSLLRSTGYDVVPFASTREFLGHGLADKPSCLILDIRLQAESGLDFQERLARENIRIPVVLMTGHGDIPMTVRGMKAGAVDFLPKPFREEEMLSAVAQAIETDRSRRTADGNAGVLRQRYESLTPREREVMGLVVTGLMNKQVAGRMNLSEITVKIHRGNVMRKMEAQSLADLVRMAEVLAIRDASITRFGSPD